MAISNAATSHVPLSHPKARKAILNGTEQQQHLQPQTMKSLILQFLGLQLTTPPMYLAYAIVVMVLRRKRHQKEQHFEETMLGELDKAIWRIDGIIKQGQSMILWYTVPLVLVAIVLLALNGKLISGWILLLFLALPLSYYGGRWEANKWYLPKKRELMAIREKLLEPPAEN